MDAVTRYLDGTIHQYTLMPNGRRSDYRLLGYAFASAIALAGLIWLGGLNLTRPAATTSNLPNGARVSSTTRDQFQELYDLGWRSDGQAGNTAVEVVYEFPQLVTRLAQYAERSFLQAQTLQTVQDESDPTLVPFLVILERNAPIDPKLEWSKLLSLKADNATYRYERFDAFSLPGAPDTQLSGIAWFRMTTTFQPNSLTMILKDIPGNIKPTTFTWDAKALQLIQADEPASS